MENYVKTMDSNELIKKIDLLSDELRSEYVEKLTSVIKEAFNEIDSKNKESLQVVEEHIKQHVDKFQEELESILKETLYGLEKRKAQNDEVLASSEETLRGKFSNVFENIYKRLKEFIS